MTAFYLCLMGGLGVATALLVFMIAKHVLEWCLGDYDLRTSIQQNNAEVNRLLEQRNKLTIAAVSALGRIAVALEVALEAANPPAEAPTSDIWREFEALVIASDGHTASHACGLCGDSGMIVTKGVQTHAGYDVQTLSQPCICPNGRALT